MGKNILMYVIFDRTEEVNMLSKLQKDYIRLLQILQGLINNEWDGADMTSQDKLDEIKKQAELIARKYGF